MKDERSYEALANYYDQLTTDINYKEWADYIHNHFKQQSLSGNMVLDLACGTGNLTFELAKLGYEMIGVDNSPDMLSQAMDKTYDFEGQSPIFLCQSMEQLDLFGTIDGCVCCLDSVNYITEPATLQRAFERVSLFLMPGGVFLFDIKTPETFHAQDGQFSLDEVEDLYCVWRTEIDEPSQMCHHSMDLFQKRGKFWEREEEYHSQRLYAAEVLETMLKKAGFESIQKFGNLSMESIEKSNDTDRIFFLALKKE